MRLRVQTDDLPDRMLSAVNERIDRALLNIREISVEDGGATIRLPLRRFPLVRRRWFGPPKQAKSPVRSRLTIRGVTRHTFADTGDLDSIVILFGLVIWGSEIFLSSAEEDQGTPCFHATFEVSEIDIEIADD